MSGRAKSGLMGELKEIHGIKDRGGKECEFKRFLDKMSAGERKQIREVVADVNTSAVAITMVLRRHGVTTSASQIRYHRRGQCLSCGGIRNMSPAREEDKR